MDDFAAPVKGIVKALDTGIKLARRASRSANSAPEEQALRISESARTLQAVLEDGSNTIHDAYGHTLRQCGESFTRALVEDSKYCCLGEGPIANTATESLQPKLKELRIDLIDQINECDFDEDEPDSFNPTAFKNVEQQVEKCWNECIDIFNDLGNRLLQANLHDFQPDERPRDDRAQLSSMRAISREGPPSHPPPAAAASPQQSRPALTLDTPPVEPVKPRSPWSMDGGAQDGIGAPGASGAHSNSAPVPQAPYRGDRVLVISPISEYSVEETGFQRRHPGPPYPVSPTERRPGRPVSEVSPMSEQPPLIGKEIVYSRLNENEQFLERRRQSRLLFQNEMRKSISSVEGDQASQSFTDDSIFSSPSLGHSTMSGSSTQKPLVSQKGSSGRSVERGILGGDKSGPWNERLVSLNDRPTSQNERSRIGEAYSDGFSPRSGSSMSPNDGRTSRASANAYETLMTRQRSQGQSSQGARSSRTSSLLQDVRFADQQKVERQDSHASQASQESIFGLRSAAPLSPPLSEHATSGADRWGHLATTLQVPGFGEGVEQGIEVVDNIDRDNGLILANEDQIALQPTPTASMKSMDYPMRHDSSFYKFGGFCDGAKALIRGETGFRIMKRPAVGIVHLSDVTMANNFQGHYSATVSARCVKCSYEVGWNDVEKDRVLDPHGIYGNYGIRFRQKFISKCHLRTNSIDEPMYACIFCIEEHRTVEEHDATVFFSVTKLFKHLTKHYQPLPNIAGLHILYGLQPANIVDFDVHFTNPEPRFGPYSMKEIASKSASRPAGYATTTHHPKNNRPSSHDPEGNPSLNFAAGARIVGITFPERFHGQWCMGYHDGERGSFPASTVMLEMPVREDVLMNAQSNLVAFAKWDFKPKDAKDGGWLKFSKGDRISAVGYTFQDQWCWSGQTGMGNKAKFGLFPAAFVEGLKEDDGIAMNGKLGTSPGAVKKSGLGLSLGSVIGRYKGSRGHERSPSVRSSGSTGSGGGIVAIPHGIEVVQSPMHSTGSWRA